MAEIETILDSSGNAYYPRTTAAAVSDTATGNLANTLAMSVRTSEEVTVENTPEDVDVYGDIATLKDSQNSTSAAVTELQNDIANIKNGETIVSKASTASTAADADKLDGKDSSEFGLKSNTFNYVLEAANWNKNIYTITIQGVTPTTNIEVCPSPTITEDEYNAMCSACILGGEQYDGSITLVAWGEVPTIDLNIVIIVRGD